VPQYTYEAVDLDGRPVKGEMAAADRSDITHYLQLSGLSPIKVDRKDKQERVKMGGLWTSLVPKLVRCLECGDLMASEARECPKCHEEPSSCAICCVRAPLSSLIELRSRLFHKSCVDGLFELPPSLRCRTCSVQFSKTTWGSPQEMAQSGDYTCPSCGASDALPAKGTCHYCYLGVCEFQLWEYDGYPDAVHTNCYRARLGARDQDEAERVAELLRISRKKKRAVALAILAALVPIIAVAGFYVVKLWRLL